MTRSQVVKYTKLTEDMIDDLIVGYVVNPINPKFTKQKIYMEKDILYREITSYG